MNGSSNPYSSATEPGSKIRPQSPGRHLRFFLPCFLFPISFLAAACILSVLQSEPTSTIRYLRTLIIDTPVPFAGVTSIYLALRLTIFRRVLADWPWLAVLGGIAAFFSMVPIYFAAIAPLLRHIENEWVHTLAMLSGAASFALFIEFTVWAALSLILRKFRGQATPSA